MSRPGLGLSLTRALGGCSIALPASRIRRGITWRSYNTLNIVISRRTIQFCLAILALVAITVALGNTAEGSVPAKVPSFSVHPIGQPSVAVRAFFGGPPAVHGSK
jgi:hypothetical protein